MSIRDGPQNEHALEILGTPPKDGVQRCPKNAMALFINPVGLALLRKVPPSACIILRAVHSNAFLCRVAHCHLANSAMTPCRHQASDVKVSNWPGSASRAEMLSQRQPMADRPCHVEAKTPLLTHDFPPMQVYSSSLAPPGELQWCKTTPTGGVYVEMGRNMGPGAKTAPFLAGRSPQTNFLPSEQASGCPARAPTQLDQHLASVIIIESALMQVDC